MSFGLSGCDKLIDKFKGCLIGGAVGDALGYPVEFLDYDTIQKIYNGDISRYSMTLHEALISDDTQMTLFTASGLIRADLLKKDNIEYEKNIYEAYQDWYNTQFKRDDECIYTSWLYEIEKLHSQRYPGTTCTGSLASRKMGSINNRINNSSGCGGVMRVAPIGLYIKDDIDKVFLLGCESAALTHGNNNAIIPAGVLASIINKIVYTNKDLKNIILESINLVKKHFKNDTDDLIALLYSAVQCSFSNDTDIEVIEKLGEGWHGDEALAIAIYCALKYHDDFESALVAAVNHSGDSDSTGSITGNILGAYIGYSNIPEYYKNNLELHDVILTIAHDLCGVNNDLEKRYMLKK